jgi:hypothetical protein
MATAMPPPPGTIELADPTSAWRPRGHWSSGSAWSRTAALLSCPLGGADTIAAETCGVRATGANAPSGGAGGPPAVSDKPGANPRALESFGRAPRSTPAYTP